MFRCLMKNGLLRKFFYKFMDMNEQQQILFMQIRILRMASERFNLSLKETAQLFKKFDVLRYIRECFGIFHVEGDEAVFDDVKGYLKIKGAAV